jgi:predicted DNA-binding antitoxin AbrB/MazE fold protein
VELRATTSLARLWQQQGKTKQDHKVLSDIYNWFTEGFDTKDLQEAKALLDSLTSQWFAREFFLSHNHGIETSQHTSPWKEQTTMETLTIHAIYENGMLRPLTPLPLQDQEEVLLKVVRHSAVQETQGLLHGLDPTVVQEVAEGDEFSVLT